MCVKNNITWLYSNPFCYFLILFFLLLKVADNKYQHDFQDNYSQINNHFYNRRKTCLFVSTYMDLCPFKFSSETQIMNIQAGISLSLRLNSLSLSLTRLTFKMQPNQSDCICSSGTHKSWLRNRFCIPLLSKRMQSNS